MLKLLVELLGSSSKDVALSTLRLIHLLMLKYEWRVSFATEGGVKAVLSCMQEFSAVTHVQQLALAVRTINLTSKFIHTPGVTVVIQSQADCSQYVSAHLHHL